MKNKLIRLYLKRAFCSTINLLHFIKIGYNSNYNQTKKKLYIKTTKHKNTYTNKNIENNKQLRRLSGKRKKTIFSQNSQ